MARRRIGDTALLRGLPREIKVLSAIAFCVALGFGIVAPSIPIYAATFGVSAFLASAVISVFALARLISAPAAGALVDRVGERRVLTLGLLIVAVSSAVAGLAQSYSQLLILRGFGGIGSSMFTVSAMALTLKLARSEQRGRAAGAFQAGFLLGGIAGPAAGGAVVALSIRAPFFVYAVTLLAAAWVSWRYLPNAPGTKPEEPGAESQPADSTETPPTDQAPEPAPEPPTLRQALRSRAFLAALAANLTNGLVMFGLRASLVPLFVISGLGGEPSLSGIGFLVAAVTQALLLLPAGRLADFRGRKPALIIGAALTIVGMLALAWSGGTWPFLVAMAISGLAGAFMGSAPAATAGDIVGPSGRGTVIAVFQMTADVGAIVGPLVAGLLADQLGFGPAFAVGAAVAALALALAAVMPETLVKSTKT